MSGPPDERRSAFRFSLAVYRLVLRRYPAEMRRRFGRDMIELFAMQLHDAVEARGVIGWLTCWLRVLRELFRPARPPLAARPLPAGRAGIPGPSMRRGSSTLETRRGPFGLGALQDLGFAWRSLRREPRFVALLVVVLGLGVAVNTSVFAVVNAYLIRPLPYPEADRVVTVRSPVQVTWADVDGVFEARVSWDLDAFTIVGDDGPQLARGAWVTTDFLDVYGVVPALGRVFRPEEGGPAAEASVAVISHRLWQGRYGGAPDVLGRTLRAYASDRPDDAESFTIVGVLPHDFWHFNDFTDVLVPLREERALYAGRLLPGMTTEDASATITARVQSRRTGLPDDFAVRVVRAQDLHVAGVRPVLLTLQAAGLLVFLIACANAAVLLLVRSVRREREFGLRRALGAGARRLTRQLVLEGTLLALGAGAFGVLLAEGVIRLARGGSALALWRGVPGGIEALRLDVPVVAAAVGLCAATGILFGLLPVATSGGRRLATSLAEVGRGGSDTRGRRRARAGLICLEIGLSVALLTGASLLIQSARTLQQANLGFDPSGVSSGQVGLRQNSYPDADTRLAFFETLTQQAGDLPGVTSVGLVNAVPFTWSFNLEPMEAEGGARAEGVIHIADAGYFDAMRIPVVRGRLFGPDDGYGAMPVAVISEAIAELMWPGEDPVGRRFREPESTMESNDEQSGPWYTVVGVVEDVRKTFSNVPDGDIYLSFEQLAPFWTKVLVRTRPGSPPPLPGLEAAVAELDPDLPLSAATDVEAAVHGAMGPSRFLATVFGSFAGFALLLSVVGLYGVMSYTAKQGRRDVAIRLALGADGRRVTRWFLRQTATVLAIGLTLGVAGGIRLGDALEGQLHGVSPRDVSTLVGVVAVLSATAFLAAWLPARTASAVAPATLLRDE